MATDALREHHHRSMTKTAGRTAPASAPTPAAPKHLPWRLLLSTVVLLGFAWLLPTIAAHTPLLQWILHSATRSLNGSVSIGSASLGWFSPISLQEVDVKDKEGKSVLTLPVAMIDRSLAGLLWNYSQLGRIRLESPKLTLVLRDDGSNIEDLIATYLAPQDNQTSSPTKTSLFLEIVDGSVVVTDAHADRSWKMEKLSANLDVPDGAEGPMMAKLAADLVDARTPGKLTAEVKLSAAGTTDSAGNEAKLSAVGLPLAMFRTLAARFSPGTTCDGRLSSELSATWGGSSGKNTVQADLHTETLTLSTPALQTDVVQLERTHAVCQVSWQADRVEIERSSIDCDLGSVALQSTLSREGTKGFTLEGLLRQQHELTGRVDLAHTARLLPATLRLREQVVIDEGQVQLSLRSRPEQQGMAWQGQLSAFGLKGAAAGRQIAWQQPLSMIVAVHQTPAGPVVDNLQCESDFLKVHASGTPDALAASLSFNLKQLSDQLGQFVNLGSLQLSGEGYGNLNWKRSPQKQFETDADVRLQNFQVALPNQPAWQEADLAATFTAKGQTNLDVDTRIDAAALNITSGADQIDARLMQPVKDLRKGGVWPVRLQAQGKLESWPGRLLAWYTGKDCRLTGGYNLVAEGTAAEENVELRQVTLAAAPLIVASPMLNMNEPKLDAVLAGSWDSIQKRLRIEPASLNCATAAVQANQIVLSVPDNKPMEITGTLKYQGDLARLRQWFSDPAKRSTWRIAGQLNGTAQLHQSSGVTRGETTTDIVNLAVVDASGQQFQEPRVRLVARGDYNSQAEQFQIEQFELASTVIATNATGRIAPVSGVNNADFSGQVGYDLERLAGLLRPYLGGGVRIVGRGSSPAWYRGPFSMTAGQSAAALRWDWANLYGLQVGPGELKATMANGLLQIEPLELAVSRGRMHLAPRVRLTPDPVELTLPKGPLAEQIQIDPILCASMLKYIAPVLADVASAQGMFSVETEGCRIPLAAPAEGELAGKFTVHSVEIGPGPLIRAFAILLGRETPAKLRRESVVQFRMVGGRVYHQGLELIFPDLTIRTYGSVGLDQTMAIMAEMPVPPKWIANNPLAAQTLQGQMIRIPIGGTLSKPELDQRVMEQLTRQFMQKAAHNLIEGEMNRQLDRLFGPKN